MAVFLWKMVGSAPGRAAPRPNQLALQFHPSVYIAKTVRLEHQTTGSEAPGAAGHFWASPGPPFGV